MPDSTSNSWWARVGPLPTESCPALTAVLWLIGGILPVLLVLAVGLSPLAAAGILLAAAVLLFFATPPRQRKYAVLLPFGAVLALLHLWAPWQNYREQLPRPECGAEIEGIVTEPLFAAESLPALAPPPTLRFSLTQLRFAPDEPWRPCRGEVILRRCKAKEGRPGDGVAAKPRDCKAPPPAVCLEGRTEEAPTVYRPPSTVYRPPPPAALPYGTRLRVAGAFSVPDAPLFPGDFDYGLYLRTLGIRHEFLAAAPETLVAPCSGWRRLIAACYHLRDRAVERIAAGLEANGTDRCGDVAGQQCKGKTSSPSVSPPVHGPPPTVHDSPATVTPEGVRLQLLSGIIFNYRAGLTPELRTQFLRSGTIHIFSVGGIHVVILGSILLLLLKLCGLPFRWRHAALPLLLGLYVVMTGSAPPAVRAWVMISFWAIARGWFFPTSSLNTIAASAIFLLLLNPLQLAQTGFVFSFTLVFFLIYGWEAASRWRAAMLEKERWRPMNCRPWWSGVHRRLLDLLSGTLLGWCASAGLIAWFNARLIPASFWVNIGIGLTTWCVLTLSLVKLLTGWLWHGADAVLARLLGVALDATRGLAELGSAPPGSLAIARPPLWSVLLFYAALLLALSLLLKRGIRRAASVLVLGVPVLWFCGTPPCLPGSRTPQLVLFAGAGAESPVVVLEQPPLPPLVINSGNFQLSRSLAQWLMLHGYDEADTLLLASSDGAKPAELLLGAAAARRVIQAAPATGPVWGALRLASAADGTGWHLVKPGETTGGATPGGAEIILANATDTRRVIVRPAAADFAHGMPTRLMLNRRPWAGSDLSVEDAAGRPIISRYLPLAEKALFMQFPLQ